MFSHVTLPITKLISHRGNINGPNKHFENNPEHIEKVLTNYNYELDVEVDLWVVNYELYLGHDKPVYNIDTNFLLKHKNNLYIHAKNLHAAHYALINNFKSFSHDKDDFVFTTDHKIWRFPNKELPVTDLTIICMPEYENRTISVFEFNNAFKICTDYVSDFLEF